MRSPVPRSEKPQSYVKELEARIMALEALVTALLATQKESPALRQALGENFALHNDFMKDPANRVDPRFRRDWNQAFAQWLAQSGVIAVPDDAE